MIFSRIGPATSCASASSPAAAISASDSAISSSFAAADSVG
jgi:hypothetical protein